MPNSIPLDPQTLLLISLRPLALVDRLILVNAVANSVFPVLIAHTTANLFVYPVGKYLPPGKRFFDEAILFLYRFFKWLVNVLHPTETLSVFKLPFLTQLRLVPEG